MTPEVRTILSLGILLAFLLESWPQGSDPKVTIKIAPLKFSKERKQMVIAQERRTPFLP